MAQAAPLAVLSRRITVVIDPALDDRLERAAVARRTDFAAVGFDELRRVRGPAAPPRKIARIPVLSPSRSDHDDADLLADGRIERLLAKYELAIIARCIKDTKNVHDGHDVAQDVMFRLFREFQAGKRYEGIPYRVVVYQVTKWTLADFFAGRRTDSPLPENLELAGDDTGDLVVSELWLREVVAQLPEIERAACTLVYLEGLGPQQAAERLGTTRNNVDQRLFHARKRLRELMGDDA